MYKDHVFLVPRVVLIYTFHCINLSLFYACDVTTAVTITTLPVPAVGQVVQCPRLPLVPLRPTLQGIHGPVTGYDRPREDPHSAWHGNERSETLHGDRDYTRRSWGTCKYNETATKLQICTLHKKVKDICQYLALNTKIKANSRNCTKHVENFKISLS